ncbi:RNA polymerase sigma-70 factor [Chondrinema litorale]|uniref:RNA polymerase sigma-70 factor n=1 Tax=Chondrinema litorale TaxID=2994555 RepID=UPI00254298DA|nr:RNA polymerase sigma-70 factor [Chondrinema litorale]UZR97542.1 RNA polymerase sigma-70 factor [Chondrinema litorale]
MHSFNKQADKELLEAISQNNENALTALYKRYFQNLCDFSFQFLKREDLAEEAVSDVFLNIWLKRGDIHITSSIRSYLYIAVRNQSYNYLKKSKMAMTEDIELAVEKGMSSALTADRFLLYSEFKEEIEELIKQMPSKRQLIFRMHRLEGFKYKEIAEILSISPNTVQNQMVEATKFILQQYPKFSTTKMWFLVLLILTGI